MPTPGTIRIRLQQRRASLCLSAEDEDILPAVGAGPHGYVLKDTPQDRLLEAIQVANAKGRYFPADTRFRISDNTARNHVNSIVEKLEVSDRAEAATTATRQGLMTD